MSQAKCFAPLVPIVLVLAAVPTAAAIHGAGRTPAHAEQAIANEGPSLPSGDQATDCPRGGKAGELLWSFPTNSPVPGSPAIAADGTLFIDTLGSELYGVSCRGEQRWQIDVFRVSRLATATTGSPVLLVDGRIVVGSSGVFGLLLMVGSDGASPKTLRYAEPIAASVLVDPQDRIFIGSFSHSQTTGSIAAFDRNFVALPGFPIVTNPITASPVYLHGNRVVFVSTNLPSAVGAISGTVTATTVFPVRRTATPTASATRPPRFSPRRLEPPSRPPPRQRLSANPTLPRRLRALTAGRSSCPRCTTGRPNS